MNNLVAEDYVAPLGLLFFDTYTGVLRLGDAVTPGGQIIGGGGGGNGVPALPLNSIQFNDNGAFGGNVNLTYDAANSALALQGTQVTSGNVVSNSYVSGQQVTAENGLLINANVVVQSYTIPPGYNAVSAGPLTIPNGVVVDSLHSNWVVV